MLLEGLSNLLTFNYTKFPMIAMRTQVEHVRLRYDTAVAASPQRAITVLAGPTSLASPPVGRAGVVRV